MMGGKKKNEVSYRSSRETSTPMVWSGASTFDLMTGAKFRNISLSAEHATVTYLRKKKRKTVLMISFVISLIHWKIFAVWIVQIVINMVKNNSSQIIILKTRLMLGCAYRFLNRSGRTKLFYSDWIILLSCPNVMFDALETRERNRDEWIF